ncbi:methyltransferase SirN-like protein [Ustulina deusta]|nr:methyltransferase SirN-like protein [Ustulina deusta]
MDNKRILAPIDLTQPGLRILDSGTVDGLFLRSIQPLLAEPYTLLGYDVMKSFFSPTAPPHTTFGIHDIAKPWPAELQGTCDLVHQRFTIPGGTKTATAREIVGHLCRLVKPGGWIQLVEMDVTGTVHGPAMSDAWAATGAFLTAAGAGTDYAKSMAGWLKGEGFDNVSDHRVDLDVGARYPDAEWGVRAFTGVVGACKSELNSLFYPAAVADLRSLRFRLVMKLDVPDSVLKDLPERARKEMIERGGIYPLVFATGQKPAIYAT